MKVKRKITKNNFLFGFMAITVFLAVVRVIFPSIAKDSNSVKGKALSVDTTHLTSGIIRTAEITDQNDSISQYFVPISQLTHFFDNNNKVVKHRIIGVANYDKSFPDSQYVQLESSKKYAVKAVLNRQDAELRKKELVYIGSNPFFVVKRLSSSIPYLVPKASILLQDIGRNFFDSLGTTFDIAYNKYSPITRSVRDDTLKWILSEVLNDLRKQGRCHIKYEKHQGCFHITIR